MTVERRLLGLWYGPAWRTVALWPLEALYRLIVGLRRRAYRSGLLAREDAGAPVVVVGNLSVGGTGKTPIASWLASALRARGLVTAVVLRGYGGRHTGTPLRVTPDTDPAIAGDEAVLHAQRGAELVFVARDRVQAARAAVAAGAQFVVSDDGLQHLRLARQYEIAVVDAARGLGNGHVLPAGPLREPGSRLRHRGHGRRRGSRRSAYDRNRALRVARDPRASATGHGRQSAGRTAPGSRGLPQPASRCHRRDRASGGVFCCAALGWPRDRRAPAPRPCRPR